MQNMHCRNLCNLILGWDGIMTLFEIGERGNWVKQFKSHWLNVFHNVKKKCKNNNNNNIALAPDCGCIRMQN